MPSMYKYLGNKFIERVVWLTKEKGKYGRLATARTFLYLYKI